MANEEKRIYHISDDEMIQFVKIKHGYFTENTPDFIQFDSDFDQSFSSNWLLMIEDVDKIVRHSTVLSQRTQLTVTVEDVMARCRNKFQHLKYFIEKAFPGNRPVWNEFGYNKYDGARKTQVKMVQFMEVLHTVSVKYKEQLIAAKYPESQIEEIKTLKDKINNADIQQELHIGDSPVLTQERIAKFNRIWEITKNVCRAGKLIYSTEPKKYERYLLPVRENHEEAATDTGTVEETKL